MTQFTQDRRDRRSPASSQVRRVFNGTREIEEHRARIFVDAALSVNAHFCEFMTCFPPLHAQVFRKCREVAASGVDVLCGEVSAPSLIATCKKGSSRMPFVQVKSFAGQNWTVAPVALAVGQTPPSSIASQKWQLTLTGVAVIDFQGDNPHDWTRATLTILPDVIAPLNYAITTYGIPHPGAYTPVIELDLWAPFAAVSSSFERETGTVDSGFAVDTWRPTHFIPTPDGHGGTLNKVFRGIDVDLAVRSSQATLHRVSYHITLIGKIVVLGDIIARK
jgi:hypothetical protein